MSPEAPVILYAEDSEDDVMLMERALETAGFTGTLMVMPHGLEAIDYLSGTGQYSDRTEYPLPRLVLLDVNMPRVSGLEVLRWIRRQEAFRETPVVMLTSSSHLKDVTDAYAAKANSFLVKPVEMDAFRRLVADLVRLSAEPSARFDARSIHGAVPAPTDAR